MTLLLLLNKKQATKLTSRQSKGGCMAIKKIEQLISMFELSKLSEMSVEFEDIKLSLKKPTQEVVQQPLISNQHLHLFA